jgi:hypothetical protein
VTLTLPEKPAVLPVNDAGIPDELKAIPCWLGWRHAPVRDKAAGGWTWKKPPYAVHGGKRGGKADPTDPESGATFADAWAAYQDGQVDGVGLQLHPVHGLFAVDLDHCIHPVTGEISRRAATVLRALPTYAELSPCWADPDGGGVRLIGRGALPRQVKKTWFEAYDRDRYVTLTGNRFADAPADVLDCPRLPKLCRRVMGVPAPPAGGDISHAANVGHGGGYARANHLSDDELLKVMFASTKTGAATTALWHGDNSAHGGGTSEADLALASHLWYWTDGNLARVDRLFRRSKRMRPKWDERHSADDRTYGQMTIATAAEGRVGMAAVPRAPAAKPRAGSGGAAEVARLETVSAAAVVAMDIPEPTWAVPGLLAEGLNLIASPPKIGKSWFALQLGVAVASGGEFLGESCEQGDVLYLALEDSDRRMKKRLLRQLNDPLLVPKRLTLCYTAPPWGGGLAECLSDWLQSHPEARLVILDTVGKVGLGAGRGGSESAYHREYRDAAALKDLADSFGVALLGLHHDRKMPDNDPLKTVSGTQGLTGAADGVLVLQRKRGDWRGNLFVTGRDIDERQSGVFLDEERFVWRLDPNGEAAKLSTERQLLLGALRQMGGYHWPTEVAKAVGKDVDAIKKTLGRMRDAGQVGYHRERGYAAPDAA